VNYDIIISLKRETKNDRINERQENTQEIAARSSMENVIRRAAPSQAEDTAARTDRVR
jgi:hypothetical protein